MSSPASFRRRRFDAFLTLAFVLALASPSFDVLARTSEQRGPGREERAAAPIPTLRGKRDWYAFPERYEAHFKDTFGLRDRLLRWRSIVQLFGFGHLPTDGMVLGRDGWLFFAGASSVEVHRGLDPFTEEELDGWIARFEARRDALARRGIAYLFAVAPNKESIYPDKVAARFNKVGPTRLDQLVQRLGARSDLPALDLRAALLDEKRRDTPGDYTYYPLGTHWNGRGHWAAYRAIADALQSRFPAVEARALDELVPSVTPDHGDTWGGRMYIDDLLPQRGLYYLHPPATRAEPVISIGVGHGKVCVYQTGRTDLPRGVVLHDSFGPTVCELLAPSFQSLACRQTMQFDWSLIESARPDVVIELYVERVLAAWPAAGTLAAANDDAERFARAPRELFRLDRASAPSALAHTDLADVAYDAGAEPPVLVVRPSGSGARFELPRIDVGDADEAILRAEVDSDGAAALRVHFRELGDDGDLPRNYRWALLAPGANEVHLRFAAAELAAPLQFLFEGSSRAYAIRSLALRGVERGD